MDFPGSEIFWPKQYENLSEMGPYGSVGAHIKTGRSPMAQDHFKTPPDPKKGHGMIKNPQKSKKSSRVGQATME